MRHHRINLEPTGCIFAQTGGQIFFADPLGKRLYDYLPVYKNMRRTIHEGNQLLMKKPIQSADSVLCVYCIYVAHVIITNRFPIGFKLNDYDLIRFAKHMLF